MRLSLRRVDVGPDDVAFLQYTGGTTGVSKGATLLHRNVVANIMQCEAWFKPMLDRVGDQQLTCLLYTSPSPRDRTRSRMPSSA